MDITNILQIICYVAVIITTLIVGVVSVVRGKSTFDFKSIFSTLSNVFTCIIDLVFKVKKDIYEKSTETNENPQNTEEQNKNEEGGL